MKTNKILNVGAGLYLLGALVVLGSCAKPTKPLQEAALQKPKDAVLIDLPSDQFWGSLVKNYVDSCFENKQSVFTYVSPFHVRCIHDGHSAKIIISAKLPESEQAIWAVDLVKTPQGEKKVSYFYPDTTLSGHGRYLLGQAAIELHLFTPKPFWIISQEEISQYKNEQPLIRAIDGIGSIAVQQGEKTIYCSLYTDLLLHCGPNRVFSDSVARNNQVKIEDILQAQRVMGTAAGNTYVWLTIRQNLGSINQMILAFDDKGAPIQKMVLPSNYHQVKQVYATKEGVFVAYRSVDDKTLPYWGVRRYKPDLTVLDNTFASGGELRIEHSVMFKPIQVRGETDKKIAESQVVDQVALSDADFIFTQDDHIVVVGSTLYPVKEQSSKKVQPQVVQYMSVYNLDGTPNKTFSPKVLSVEVNGKKLKVFATVLLGNSELGGFVGGLKQIYQTEAGDYILVGLRRLKNGRLWAPYLMVSAKGKIMGMKPKQVALPLWTQLLGENRAEN